MTSIVHLDEATRHDLIVRLKRLEGQAHGTGADDRARTGLRRHPV